MRTTILGLGLLLPQLALAEPTLRIEVERDRLSLSVPFERTSSLPRRIFFNMCGPVRERPAQPDPVWTPETIAVRTIFHSPSFALECALSGPDEIVEQVACIASGSAGVYGESTETLEDGRVRTTELLLYDVTRIAGRDFAARLSETVKLFVIDGTTTYPTDARLGPSIEFSCPSADDCAIIGREVTETPL